MKIPPEIRQTYTTFDPEADLFLDFFDEEPLRGLGTRDNRAKLLEVGAQHSPVSSMLASMGFDVTGIDLRDCDQTPNYRHLKADFCNLPADFLREHAGTFDCAVSVSAIEHFGLNTYGEGRAYEYYDVVAMHTVYTLLRPGGVCYLTVPFGGKFVEVKPHWRVYDFAALMDRLVQSFLVEVFTLRVVESFQVGDRKYQSGLNVGLQDVIFNVHGYPYISTLVKLRKPA